MSVKYAQRVATKRNIIGHDYTRGAFRSFRRDRILEIYASRTVRAKKAQRMLMGMAQRKILGIKADANNTDIGYQKLAADIGDVHHHGKTAKVSKNGPRIRYPERQLLGVSQSDQKALRDLLLKHLSEKS